MLKIVIDARKLPPRPRLLKRHLSTDNVVGRDGLALLSVLVRHFLRMFCLS